MKMQDFHKYQYDTVNYIINTKYKINENASLSIMQIMSNSCS